MRPPSFATVEGMTTEGVSFTSVPGSSALVDSARANLAGTFVNAFVNAGFGNDKLMVEAEEGSSWIYKNKEHGESIERNDQPADQMSDPAFHPFHYRYDVGRCQLGSQHALGHGRRTESH